MTNADATEARRQRGLAIAATCRIAQKNGQWVVPSLTGNGHYRVNLKPASPVVPMCTCPDFEKRGQPCKHVFAVQFVIQRETHPDGSETVTQTITVKQTCAPRPTYKQDWPAYNQAQRNEKPRFQALLHDLCLGIEEPEQETGRPRQPLRDVVFASVFKVYSTVSGRRFMGDLADAHAKGHISRPMHYNTISKYLEMEGMTLILRRLIEESARPLASVESDFAVDSSGFATSRFIRWFDHKYGQPKQEYDWVKCHLMAGVKTNIVAAVELGERYAADCPQFIPLVNATAQRFTINEVSADKAYSSYDNMEAVAGHGGTPFIAFRVNATGRDGGIYEKMFHYYSFNRDEYLSHYHKRSNIESTFSMLKAKFGDHLRSKTDRAMMNEALAKVLCHNICCLIQSTYELGIEAKFWRDESAKAPAAEPAYDELEAFTWV
jgi:transposase